jgi:parallel beta-helix repeat protein
MSSHEKPVAELFVSLHGDDQWSGRLPDPNEGGSDGPFASLERARDEIRSIRKQEALTAGRIVVWVRGGIYRRTDPFTLTAEDSGTENLSIEYRAWLSEEVVIKGSYVMDPAKWQQADCESQNNKEWIYPEWVPQYRDLGREFDKIHKHFGIDQAHRRSWSDQLFMNGRIMTQVYNYEDLKPYSFWVSAKTGCAKLHLQLPESDDPTDAMMEASIAQQLIVGKDIKYVTIKGFHLSQACNRVQMAVLQLDSGTEHCLLEDNKVSWTNGTGIAVSGRNHLIRRNVAEYNSQNGICGSRLKDTLFEYNAVRMNNWNRPITHTWESGGGKFALCDNVTLRYHEAACNLGPGIWFDIDNSNITIEKCRAYHNNYCGIFFEISMGPVLIKDNFCFGNDGAGILIAESDKATVVNNTCAFNKYGINLRNMLGRSYGETEEYKLDDVEMSNNLLANNHTAGIVNSWEPIDTEGQKIRSFNNVFFGNGTLVSWVVENKSEQVESDDWGAIASGGKPERVDYDKLEDVQREQGIEQGSYIKNPKFVLSQLYELKSVLEDEGIGASSK